jgi:hypothetical protein
VSLNYTPGPTGSRFLHDDKFIKLICGPVGGGKSTVCLFDLFKRSLEQHEFAGVRRTKFIIMRNTSAQLTATVKPLIDQWFVTLTKGSMGAWALSRNTFEARFKLPDGTQVHSDYVLLAADTPDDVRRLLSVECSGAWVEECREIDPTVFEGLQGRTMRWPNMASGGVRYPGVICSTNPPPMGTYWQELMASPPENMSVFMQPPALLDDGTLNPDAENLENLHPEYYDNLVQGKTEDWIDVYLKNKFGAGGFGQPIFKSTFKTGFHVAAEPLKPVVSTNPLIVGMDNGLTAAAVAMQMDARGRVNVLAESYVPEGQSMGVETFLDKLLTPHLLAKFPRVKPEQYMFVLDPACFQRSQVNEVTIAQAVSARGYRIMRASTNDPERRIAAVEGLLMRAIDGGPGFLISPECTWLTRALDWGYRNKKQANGVVTAVPEKNHYSHIADALQYGCLHYNLTVNPAAHMNRTKAREIVQKKYSYV